MNFNLTIALFFKAFMPGISSIIYIFALFYPNKLAVFIESDKLLVLFVLAVCAGIIIEAVMRLFLSGIIILNNKREREIKWFFSRIVTLSEKYYKFPLNQFNLNPYTHYLYYSEMPINARNFLSPTMYRSQGYAGIFLVSLFAFIISFFRLIISIIFKKALSQFIVICIVSLVVAIFGYYLAVFSMINLIKIHEVIFSNYYYENKERLDKFKIDGNAKNEFIIS